MNILSIYSLCRNLAAQFLERNRVLPLAVIISACALTALLPLQAQAQCSVSFTDCPSNYTILDCDHSGDEPIYYPLIIANPTGPCGGFILNRWQGPAPGSVAFVGQYQIEFQAIGLDANQNQVAYAYCLFTVTIAADQQPPTIKCPPDITVQGIDNGSGSCSAPAYWAKPTITDNCDYTSTIAYDHACGSLFPSGTTTVNASTVDPSGNPAQCSFTVTVICTSDVKNPFNAENRLKITPNPNAGDFSVELFQPATHDMFFRIIDPTGRLVLEKQTETGVELQQVQAGNLPAGMYFLQLISEGRVTAFEKFVKQ